MRVVIDRLSKTYRERGGQAIPALSEINLGIEAEEFLALVGPSGCGKSTLLNIVAGLLTPTSGGVFFEGPIDGSRPTTAMVFQEFALFPWRTVRANIEFGLEDLSVAAGERRETALSLVKLVGLSGFESKYPHQLSGGMRQRVGIARALAVDPAVLLMDEPFSALDAQARQILQLELLSIWEQTRKTILYVTHNIQEAVFMADRVAVLSRRPGRLIEVVRVELGRPRHEGMLREPAFLSAAERIWKSIKSEAQQALVEGGP